MNEEQLIFVYNSGSGLFSSIRDFAHKILSPATYQCKLCPLSHGNFSMKQEWKSFLETLPIKSAFIYKDEFRNQYKLDFDFPAVFIVLGGSAKELVSKEEINNCNSL